MDDFKLSDIEERIESILVTIIHNKPDENLITPSLSLLDDLKHALNQLFADAHILCTNVIFTNNTDKPFFGIMVNPSISGTDAMAILATDDVVKISKYEIEIDSKIFNLGLDSSELAATIIFEISSMLTTNAAIENTRAIIDLNNLKDDDVIYLRDSANYAQLIIYALKDTMYKVSSIMFKTDIDEIISNLYIQELDLQDFIVSAQQKVSSSIFGVEDTLRDPKASIMNWMLLMYKDMQHNSRAVKDTLKDAKEFTGSRLNKQEIDKTLDCVSKIDNQIVIESTIDKFFDVNKMTAVNELSIFQSLKKNGLRGIEDALYEYALRLKTCETEEEAMYILRGLNTRLNILEDYLYSNPDISDNERKHWEDVARKYRALREELSKKKLWNKKQYGLFFDYSQLDNLDENYEEDADVDDADNTDDEE